MGVALKWIVVGALTRTTCLTYGLCLTLRRPTYRCSRLSTLKDYHRPLHIQLDINWSKADISLAHSYRKPVAYRVRWDKGSLGDYYCVTGDALSSLKSGILGFCCSPGCQSPSHQHAINLYYDKIIAALRNSERCTIPRIPHAALKPFWNDELDDLKEKSICWHNLWKSAVAQLRALYNKLKQAVN